MGKGLTYAQKLAIARQTELTIGVDIGFQKAADFFAIALYEEGFGPQRQEKIVCRVMELDSEYGDAWTDGNEADYKQEQIDRILKKAFGEKFESFFERNPYIKKANYAGKGKC